MERTNRATRDISGVPADATILRILGDGSTLFSSPTEGKFVYVREECGSRSFEMEVNRQASANKPALAFQVKDTGGKAHGILRVGPVMEGQKELAARLMTEARLLKEAAENSKFSGRGTYLQQAAQRKLVEVDRLTAGVIAKVDAGVVSIKMSGRAVGNFPVAAVIAKGETLDGEARVATFTLGSKAQLEKYVREKAFDAAISDQREQPKPGKWQQFIEQVDYVIHGGSPPKDAQTARLHDRFVTVEGEERKRIYNDLDVNREKVISVPSEEGLGEARKNFQNEIAQADREEQRMDQAAHRLVELDTVAFGCGEGGTRGASFGSFLSDLASSLFSSRGGVLDGEGYYSREGSDVAMRYMREAGASEDQIIEAVGLQAYHR